MSEVTDTRTLLLGLDGFVLVAATEHDGELVLLVETTAEPRVLFCRGCGLQAARRAGRARSCGACRWATGRSCWCGGSAMASPDLSRTAGVSAQHPGWTFFVPAWSLWGIRPCGAVGVSIAVKRARMHRCPKPRPGWREVAPVAHDDRIDEVLVQMIYVLDHTVVLRRRNRDVVEHGEVLYELAQANAASVRADGHAELGGEEEDGQVLIDAGHAGPRPAAARRSPQLGGAA